MLGLSGLRCLERMFKNLDSYWRYRPSGETALQRAYIIQAGHTSPACSKCCTQVRPDVKIFAQRARMPNLKRATSAKAPKPKRPIHWQDPEDLIVLRVTYEFEEARVEALQFRIVFDHYWLEIEGHVHGEHLWIAYIGDYIALAAFERAPGQYPVYP